MSAAPGLVSLEALAIKQFGEPNRALSTRREWRFGSKGSLSVVIHGRKAGFWYDHESGQGGRLSEQETVPRPQPRANLHEVRSEAQRIERARRLWAEAEPVQATLGERYLIETRGISRPDGGWPDAVRYHRAQRSVILAATLADGTLQAVHVVRLAPDAQNARRHDGSKIKLSFGVLAGATVRLPGVQAANLPLGPLLLAEGPETGLSLWAATGRETWIALGSLAKAANWPLFGGRRVVVCRDDDAPASRAAVALDAALEQWRGQGLELAIATPWQVPRADKSDFNDTLREAGPEAVRERIRAALLAAIGCAPADPPSALPTETLKDARWDLTKAAEQFFFSRPADGEPAPQMLLGGQGGIGKTEVAGGLLAPAMREAKNAGRPHRAIVLAPEHKVLGHQIVERLRAFGLDVAHLIGRGDAFAPKPDDLCKNPEAVREAIRAKQDIRKSVCGTLDGPHCPLLTNCEYIATVERASQAEVVVAAHNFVFHRLAKRVWHDVGFVVIDEDFTTHGDRIFGLTVETFTKPALDLFPPRYQGNAAAPMTGSLAKLHKALHEACEASPDGYLSEAALRAAGLTPALCIDARKLEWTREVKIEMTPGMELEKRREIAREAAINSQLPQLAAVWDAAHAILTEGENGSGRITLTTHTGRRGVWRELTVLTQHKVASWLTDLPVLMLNSTARLDDVQRFFPATVEHKPPAVAAPYATADLVLGGFAKSTLAHSPRKLSDLRAYLWQRFLGVGDAGLVTHLSTVESLGPANLPVLHHGANAGDDSMRDVGALAVIDGLRARPAALAELAAARTGRAIMADPPVPSMAPVLMRDGSGVAVPVLAYADPAMQAVHAGIHNASVMQAAARARQVMRTAANPVHTIIFGNVAPPGIVFDRILRWKDERPDRLVHMAYRARLHGNAATMTALHPDLFATERAAERARDRFGDVSARLRELLTRDCRPWVRVRWQKPGQGCRPEWSLCPAAELATMRAEIEAAFGEVAQWSVAEFTAGKAADLPVWPSGEEAPGPVLIPQTAPGASSPLPPAWMLENWSDVPIRPPDG